MENPQASKSRGIEVGVWKRGPWLDLTHQEEFYSSASLRGVKPMGKGVKGRLGTFSYLLNPAISALDFSNHTGRQVRARIGAASTVLNDGTSVPILFVDGVEGSNSIKVNIIRAAIGNAYPLALIPFLGLTGAGLYFHLAYQKKGFKKAVN